MNRELAKSGIGEVQGPINREPEEKADTASSSKGPTTGIRRLYVLDSNHFLLIVIHIVHLLDVSHLLFEFHIASLVFHDVHFFANRANQLTQTEPQIAELTHWLEFKTVGSNYIPKTDTPCNNSNEKLNSFFNKKPTKWNTDCLAVFILILNIVYLLTCVCVHQFLFSCFLSLMESIASCDFILTLWFSLRNKCLCKLKTAPFIFGVILQLYCNLHRNLNQPYL